MGVYTVKPNQNLFDVALHLYGSIEGLFDLLISNPELNMTSDLVYGQELIYHEGISGERVQKTKYHPLIWST